MYHLLDGSRRDKMIELLRRVDSVRLVAVLQKELHEIVDEFIDGAFATHIAQGHEQSREGIYASMQSLRDAQARGFRVDLA